MAGKESSRRGFLKRIGMVAATAAIANTAWAQVDKLSSEILPEKPVLSPEQSEFMSKYTHWLEEFHQMAKLQKVSPGDSENNKKLVALSDEARAWQDELIAYMRDENFSRHYLMVTEKVTQTI